MTTILSWRARLHLIVRDIHHSGLQLLVQLSRIRAHIDAQLRIKVRERLIERINAGLRTIARPMATRCRWPPESCFGLLIQRVRELQRFSHHFHLATDLRFRHFILSSARSPCSLPPSCADRAHRTGRPSPRRGGQHDIIHHLADQYFSFADLFQPGNHAQ